MGCGWMTGRGSEGERGGDGGYHTTDVLSVLLSTGRVGGMRILETLTSCSFQITLDSCCQGRRLGEGVREWEVKVEGEETDVLL